MRKMAELYYRDWPHDIGLIGMQEVKTRMTSCTAVTGQVHGAQCFAELLEDVYGQSADWRSYGELGIVVGFPWEIIGTERYELSRDTKGATLGSRASMRLLLGVKVRHSTHGWILRFYTTHLSHDSKWDNGTIRVNRSADRILQVNKLVRLVRNMAEEAELPPIIVGDFNMGMSDEEFMAIMMGFGYRLANLQAVGCLENGRPIPVDIGIDHIWYRYRGQQTQGYYTPIRYHTSDHGGGIDFKARYQLGDYWGKLSDHNSPGITFSITNAFSHPITPSTPVYEGKAADKKIPPGSS
ncbi:endonuclease/exonuclease/phosphatase family protein [Gemmatimonadota bacterium]